MQARIEQKPTKSAVFDQRFQILSTVGRGRNSIVYKARSLSGRNGQNGVVAVKVLTGNAKTPEHNILRMKREALAMLSSRNENVVRLNDFVTAGDVSYLCMEFADQKDLRFELERRQTPFTPRAALLLVRQVLCGLEAIHQAGIIHRDIKPENLLLNSSGELKIADFGIAKLPTEDLLPEEISRGVGTLEYLAPESLDANLVDEKTDVYSAGVTLYQLVTNDLPFGEGSLTDQIKRKMAGQRIPLSEYINHVPDGLEEILDRALATDPKLRFQNAQEFRDEIDRIIERLNQPASSKLLLPKKELLEKQATGALKSEKEQEKDGLVHGPVSLKLGRMQSIAQEQAPKQRVGLGLFVTLLFAVVAGVIFIGYDLDLKNLDLAAIQKYLTKSPRTNASTFVQSSSFSLLHPDKEISDSVRTIQGATYFPAGQHAGILYNLFADDTLVVFFIDRSPLTNEMLFTLNIPGWSSPVVNLSHLDDLGEVAVRSGGIHLVFQPTDDDIAPGAQSVGKFKDMTTGRSGNWVLW